MYTDISAIHEVYEDLGVRESSILDPSFNVNNFDCESVPQSHPDRSLAFERTLSGTTNISAIAHRLSPKHQSLYSAPAVSGPVVAPAQTMADEEFGVYKPISELFCLSSDGPCYGENGEVGFSTHNDTCLSKKERFWLNESTAVSFAAQSTAIRGSASEGANVSPCSALSINGGAYPLINRSSMPPNLEEEDFQFPSWNQLPLEFQDPTTSAGYNSTIPISTTGADMFDLSTLDSSASTAMPWDNEDMNFSMDLDLDLDLDIELSGFGM
jgi:hypothetical protein